MWSQGPLGSVPLRRVSIWPFLAVVPGELSFVWLAEGFSRDDSGQFVSRSLPLYLASVVLSLLIVEGFRRFAGIPRSRLVWLAQYATAVVASSVLVVALLEGSLEDNYSGVGALVLVTSTRLANIVLFAYVLDFLVGRWKEASASARDLRRTLDHVQQVNDLLAAAERSMYAQQTLIIRTRVLTPIRQLARSSPGRTNGDLADEVDELVTGTMRPLAHQLHPVTLSVGLVACVRSLAQDFVVEADPVVLALDSSGQLLDSGVRLQVYRWIRAQVRGGEGGRVCLEIDGRRLLITSEGLGYLPRVDAMMAVAGIEALRDDGDGRQGIAAPLRGQFVDQVIAGDVDPAIAARMQEPSDAAARPSLTAVLTMAAGHRTFWTGFLALLALPTAMLILATREQWASAIPIAAWLVVPIGVAAVLDLIPVRSGSRLSAAWVVISWLLIGLSASFAEIAADVIVSSRLGDNESSTGTGFIMLRGFMRFTLGGLLITGALGAAAQARKDNDLLRIRLGAALDDRVHLLDQSDRLDRYVAEKLHRTVQGRLSAISLLLRLDRRQEALDELDILANSTVPALAASLGAAVRPNGETFIDASDIPLGLELTEAIDPAALALLDREQVDDFRTVAAECAVNALRHGGATSITVSLQVDDDIVLTCADDGTGMSSERTPGLGSALFDEVARRQRGEWRAVPTAGGATISLRIPKPVEPNETVAMGITSNKGFVE